MGKERPGVSWEEWDGMLRVCFVRKNKTLRASWLGSKEVLAMCERNYRVWCALNNIGIEDQDMEGAQDATTAGGFQAAPDEEELGGIMDVDDAHDGDDEDVGKTKSKKKKTRTAELVKEKISKVLEETELADKRAAQCHEGDFLKLLYAFNNEGIHFA